MRAAPRSSREAGMLTSVKKCNNQPIGNEFLLSASRGRDEPPVRVERKEDEGRLSLDLRGRSSRLRAKYTTINHRERKLKENARGRRLSLEASLLLALRGGRKVPLARLERKEEESEHPHPVERRMEGASSLHGELRGGR